MTVNLDGEQIVINDVWFGDVYLMGGQSNMGFPLCRTHLDPKDYQSNDNIRMYRLNPEATEDSDFNDVWHTMKKETVGPRSALAYFVALELSKFTDHKIAMLMCEKGATVIQSFMPKGYFDGTEIGNIPDNERSIDFRHPEYTWNYDGCLYERTFEKMIPYSVKLAVWYQGEGNASGKDPYYYDKMLTEFLKQWRSDLKDSLLPFIIVQIAEYTKWPDQEGWRIVKEMQKKVTESVENTYLVKSDDVCEIDDIHPPTKDLLAKRIADIILKLN